MSNWFERGISGLRRLVGAGAVGAADEAPHAPTPGAAADWSERYRFAFHDAPSGLAGAATLDLRPNARETRADFAIFLPDGTAVALGDRVHAIRRKGIVGGKLVFRAVEPMQRWEVLYQGPLVVVEEGAEDGGRARKVKADVLIQWAAAAAAHDFAGDLDGAARERLGATGLLPAGHYEQPGRLVGGHAQIGRTRIEFKEAASHRAHAWGARAGGGTTLGGFVRFADDLAIGFGGFEIAGAAHASGCRWSQGQATALRSVELAGLSDPDAPLVVAYRDREGAIRRAEGERLRTIRETDGASRRVTTLARFRLDGREGMGVVERVAAG